MVVIHEASGRNDNIRDICRRLAEQGYTALGVDLFAGRNRAVCIARMFIGAMSGDLDYFGVPALKAALGQLADRPEVDAGRIGAIGFCLGGSIVLTWACTQPAKGIAPHYGAAPRPREAMRRLCPVVGSWPDKDFTTGAAATLETELSAARHTSRPQDLPRNNARLLQRPEADLRRRGGRRRLGAGARLLRRARQARLGHGLDGILRDEVRESRSVSKRGQRP